MNHLSASPRSGIPAPKTFSFAPIAVAVAAVFAAAASPSAFASHTAFQYDPGDNTKGVITLKLENISIGEDSEWLNASGALFTVDGFPINNPDSQDDIPVRTAIKWWFYDSETNNPLYSAVNSQGIPTDEHVALTVTSNTDDFNLGWDFANDSGEYYPYSPAIANFRPEVLDADSNDRYLKRFTFQSKARSQIAVVTKNSLVGSTNSGDGEAMLGLSVLNKRGWMTFADETFLVSDFQFLYPDQIETASVDPSIPSGTEGQYIAAGVVTGFGASTNRPVNGQRLFDQLFTKDENGLTAEVLYKESLDKYGRIDFEKRSVVSVTAIASKDENFENHRGRLHEVFGVFANEGGAVEFMKGGDVLVKGRDKHHLVSALTSASTLGILDPLKSGEITFTAGTEVNRIWGWSDSYDGDTPITVENGEDLFNQGKLNDNAFVDMKGQIEDYLKKATGTGTTTEQHLRGSILAANGSNITVQDTADGWLDIRGDVVAAVKNGNGAGSNTFVAQGKDLNDGVHANSMVGTVTRATVNLTLSHENSTLVGNVYERHRVGDEEAVRKETNGGTSAIEQYQSFKDWQDEQYKAESLTLGGTVNLSISGGAVWYPTKDWKGWNYDFLYQEFFDETGNNDYGTVNTGYEYYDTSDQYNLHVKAENGSYEPANQPVPADGESVDSGKINDLDLLDHLKEREVPYSIKVANEKPRDDQGHQTYTTVDAGVYHLKLDGGTVDLSYLRRDFLMSTAQEDLGLIRPGETIEVEDANGNGIKKFRVQALNGKSGNFRIYARDATHHDLVIVDEMRDAQNVKHEGKSFDLNLVLWNDGIGDEHKLTIDPNDPLTYIQVARVPDSVNVTAESYGEGRTTYTAYRVVKDEKTVVDGVSKYVDGSITYDQGLDWHEQNVNWFITREAENRNDMAVIGTTELAANLGYLMATTVETLRDRRGEMTFNGTKEDGWWVRYTHDRFGLEGFTAETDGFQFGYEWMKPEEGGRLFRGAALDVAQGDVDYDNLSGESEADRYRLSAYQTYMGDNGVYYDAVLRAGWYDAETNVAYTRDNGTVYDMRGNFDYWAAAASFEAGHRFESDSAWWIEPEVQLQYTYIADYDYKTNQGIRIDTDDTQSLIGRFGVRMGKVLTSDAGRHMSVWAGADVFHEWLGDRDGTMTGIDETVRYDIEGDDTWWDAVFGMTWETGPDSRLWAAAKHDFGGDKENTWTVNVGATWNF